MRHSKDGRQFGRNSSHRKAMFRNLANAVIVKEQVTTTVEKAKETRRVVERLITLGKGQKPAQRRLAFDRTRDDFVVTKLFTTLAERYKDRKGGYTRILKLSDRRRGDAAEMAVFELVDHPEIKRKKKIVTVSADAKNKDAEKADADAKPVDTQKGIKRLFGGKKKGAASSGGAPKSAATAQKGGAKKSAPKKV